MNKKNLRMKDIPESERPSEKFESIGVVNLSDAELLAIILRTGTRNEKITDMMQRILSIDKESGLEIINNISIEELLKIKGIGKVKAMQLKCIGEIASRMAKIKAKKRLTFDNPSSVAAYYIASLKNMKKECIRALLLDSQLKVISDELISNGSIDRLVITPVEIFQKAIVKLAKSMIIVHNHPSGNPEPSEADLEFTTRIVICGRMLGINVEDHIIVGNENYISLRKEYEKIFKD